MLLASVLKLAVMPVVAWAVGVGFGLEDRVLLGVVITAVAAKRLKELVEYGLLEKCPYREPGQRTRHEYVLTERGHDLWPVLVALGEWSRKHSPAKGGPTLLHDGCDAEVRRRRTPRGRGRPGRHDSALTTSPVLTA